MSATKGLVIAGKYRLERPLARGGMGAVWVATHLGLDAPVAVKCLAPALSGSPEAIARFEREAKAAAQLRGAHVVQIFDHGVDGELPYIVMELLEGEDLGTRLDREGRLSLGATVEIVRPIGAALEKAHAAGIVHRDLKPANVFLSDQALVKVVDFGIAKELGDGDGNVTKTGDVVGSPLFMSPEQIRSAKSVDHRSDLWSLGVIAYRALTGVSPFAGESSGEILIKVATEPAAPPSMLVPELPEAVDAFFTRALAKKPAERFQSAAEMVEAFTALTGDSPKSAVTNVDPAKTVAPAAPARQNGWIAGVLLLAAAALGAWWLFAAKNDGQKGAPAAAATQTASAGPTSEASATASSPVNVADDTTTVWRIPVGDSRALGGADALVTIVEFGELQCPFTRRTEPAVERILAEYSGKVRLVWKDFYVAPHLRAEPAAHVIREVLISKGPDAAWVVHRLLIAGDTLDDESLLAAAKDVGVDGAAARAALSERRYQRGIDADNALGDAFEITITPTFFVNGRRLSGPQGYEALKVIVEDEIRRAEPLVKAGATNVYATRMTEARADISPERRAVNWTGASPWRDGRNVEAIIHEFGDLDDPLTRMAEPTVREILEAYQGRVMLIWRDRPLATRSSSMLAAMAAREAEAQQGLTGFWALHDRLLGDKRPDEVTTDTLVTIAVDIGLDATAFRAGLGNPEHNRTILADTAAASDASLDLTPSFVVTRKALASNKRIEGYVLRGPQAYRRLKRVIDRALGEQAE